jgi:tetratricopeptide (TPR) repeat protein
MDATNKGLTNFPKYNWGWILTLIALIADIITLAQWLQGGTSFSTYMFLEIGIIILWISLFYIYFEKRKVGELWIDEKASKSRIVNKPLYPEWMRALAFSGIFAIPILNVIGIFGWQDFKIRTSHKTVIPSAQLKIGVADFDGPNPQYYRVTETIIKELRDATKDYSDIQVQPLKQTISAYEDSENVRILGKKNNVNIVIWGWYGKTEEKVLINVHFELLRKPRYLALRQEQEILKLAVADLDTFRVQIRISREMLYLTLVTKALMSYEAKDYDDAIACFSTAISQAIVPEQMIDPSAAYFYRGRIYDDKSDFERAIAEYDQAIALNPHDVKLYINRGLAYTNKGDTDHAIADFDYAIKLKPKDADIYNNRGVVYANKREYDRSIAEYDQAIKLKPDYAEAYNNRGIVYKLKGDYDNAIADYDQAIKFEPELAEAYYNRGIFYYDNGDIDKAIIEYEQAIKFKRDFLEAYNNRGLAYYKKDWILKAIDDYNRALKLRPDDVDGYIKRGISYYYLAYYLTNDYGRAIYDFDKVIKLKPNEATVIIARAIAHKKKGDYDKAIADYDQAIKIKPQEADLYINRGTLQKNKNNYNQAIADYDQAITIKPEYSKVIKLKYNIVDTYNKRGLDYFKKGDYDHALADFDRVITLTPSDADAYYNRGLTYKLKGDKNNARNDFKRALVVTRDQFQKLIFSIRLMQLK